mmetsp:Transcript_8028/g.29838  ORF Transcript_8028/g.29838 Transcript_8028/m.29838 type:complete len:136 (-) Transcript_8028:5997-6404(-)
MLLRSFKRLVPHSALHAQQCVVLLAAHIVRWSTLGARLSQTAQRAEPLTQKPNWTRRFSVPSFPGEESPHWNLSTLFTPSVVGVSQSTLSKYHQSTNLDGDAHNITRTLCLFLFLVEFPLPHIPPCLPFPQRLIL